MATGNFEYCISLLQDNEEPARKEAQQVLAKICANIINNPQDSRYRRIRLANAIIANKLLSASGAIECLFEAGFLESDDGFLLPIDASLAGVEHLHSLLLNDLQQKQQPRTDPVPAPAPAVQHQKPNNTWLAHLTDHSRTVLRYESKSLQTKAKSILPLHKLEISAMEKLRAIQREMKLQQQQQKKVQDDVVFEDLLLAELLAWFKFKFFTWVDTLACQMCMGECFNDGSRASPNPRLISRIEIHKCKSCKYENQFARYTDPEVLLSSRRGRCGEWANCFTLICRSVGFDARLVYDETDHVWTEVWSVAHNRWIHADACENAMDRPLLYERGWGKKLSYVLAFSKDEIQDVTWRYTSNPEAVMRRRKHCSEEALALFIRNFNEERQTSKGYQSTARRKFVLKRSALDLAGMLNAPPGQVKPAAAQGDDLDDYEGRTSGSLAWRISRGELATRTAAVGGTQWYIPNGTSSFQLLYDIVSDTYTTLDATTGKTLEVRRGWQNGIQSVEGAQFCRKEEPDWKMVYLARSPGQGSSSGKITWTLKLAAAATKELSTRSCVSSVTLQTRATKTFSDDARVEWLIEARSSSSSAQGKSKKVCAVDDCCRIDFENTELPHGTIEINVSAILHGGQGDLAWQHAQLFRTSLAATAAAASDDKHHSKEPFLLIQVDQMTNKIEEEEQQQLQ